MFKPSHIYATQYKPYNACIMHVHVLNQWKWKFVLKVLLLHVHVLILDFFLRISQDKVSLIIEKFKDGI